MKILSVAFSIEGDTRIMKGDALEHEGRLWLVVQWLGNPAEGPAKPRRLIELDQFQLQRFPQTRLQRRDHRRCDPISLNDA
jgi:hypothetical protein